MIFFKYWSVVTVHLNFDTVPDKPKVGAYGSNVIDRRGFVIIGAQTTWHGGADTVMTVAMAGCQCCAALCRLPLIGMT